MNERILSPQLLKLVQDAGPGYSLADPEWVKKFAELIVRECVAEARDDCAGWTERDQCLVMQVMDRIMLHFGVDE